MQQAVAGLRSHSVGDEVIYGCMYPDGILDVFAAVGKSRTRSP
jgi:hypothetical protein